MQAVEAQHDRMGTDEGTPACEEPLEQRQVALVAQWREAATHWFGVVGKHADELTDKDRHRIQVLEARIVDAIVAADRDGLGRLICSWQAAATPLRWLPHGRFYRGGAWYESQVATYRQEASLRGIGAADLCPGEGECGGACV